MNQPALSTENAMVPLSACASDGAAKGTKPAVNAIRAARMRDGKRMAILLGCWLALIIAQRARFGEACIVLFSAGKGRLCRYSHMLTRHARPCAGHPRLKSRFTST